MRVLISQGRRSEALDVRFVESDQAAEAPPLMPMHAPLPCPILEGATVRSSICALRACRTLSTPRSTVNSTLGIRTESA